MESKTIQFIQELMDEVTHGMSLNTEQAEQVLTAIIEGRVESDRIKSFLIALRKKEETLEELLGFRKSLMQKAIHVSAPRMKVMDLCGTGGDRSGTFNVSTTVAFVVAAAGQAVAKHGNRSVSSRSGAFDVLDALGVYTCLDAASAQSSLEEFGVAFLFAPAFHPSLKVLSPIRKEIGVTVLNALGPLLNPVPMQHQMIGVYSEKLQDQMALILKNLNWKEARIVRGKEGLDEISISGPTRVVHLKNDAIQKTEITPEKFGLKRAKLQEVLGGSADENAVLIHEILNGEQGARRDLVLLNAAVALMTSEQAQDPREAIEKAKEAVDSGRAAQILKRMIKKRSDAGTG